MIIKISLCHYNAKIRNKTWVVIRSRVVCYHSYRTATLISRGIWLPVDIINTSFLGSVLWVTAPCPLLVQFVVPVRGNLVIKLNWKTATVNNIKHGITNNIGEGDGNPHTSRSSSSGGLATGLMGKSPDRSYGVVINNLQYLVALLTLQFYYTYIPYIMSLLLLKWYNTGEKIHT